MTTCLKFHFLTPWAGTVSKPHTVDAPVWYPDTLGPLIINCPPAEGTGCNAVWEVLSCSSGSDEGHPEKF